MTVQVAKGKVSRASRGGRDVEFARLRSAVMDVHLTGPPDAMPLPRARAEAGAIYRGLLVGAWGPDGIVTPVSATWPDRLGRLSWSSRRASAATGSASGRSISRPSPRRPPGPAACSTSSSGRRSLPPSAPRDVATLQIPPP